MDRTSPPSQKTTPPVIPFLPLDLRMRQRKNAECNGVPHQSSIPHSVLMAAVEKFRHPHAKPQQSLNCHFSSIGRRCLLKANQAQEQFQIMARLSHLKQLAKSSPEPSKLQTTKGCCSKTEATSRTVLQDLQMLNSANVTSRNFGSTPIVSESSTALR